MMRKLLFFAAIFMCANVLLSQQLYLETGKTIASFDYENSFGETLDNLHSTNHTYLTLGFRKSVWTERLFLNFNASYNGYGAIGSDRALDNYFEWDLSYLGAGFGFDFEFFKPGDFTFFVKATANAEFLIQGTQTLNKQVYNLPGETDFDTPIYAFRGGLGIQYKVSGKITVFNQYMYGYTGTFKNIQGKLNIKSHNFGIGLLISIAKNQVTETTSSNEAQLEQLQMQLDANAKKIQALEEKTIQMDALKKEMVKKDNEIETLKTAIYNALYPYKGSELQIVDRQGKVYITLENDLLFNSGSATISDEGKKALQDLGSILAKNPNVTVVVEGHTDNQPFKNANMTNRELSLQRASAVVELLSKTPEINNKNLVAAGIGEFQPIADNNTEEGRAKNRRIEIVLTPELSELIEIIKN